MEEIFFGAESGKEEDEMSTEKETRDNQVKYALAAFLSVLLFVIFYKYSLNQLWSEGIADLKAHAKHAADIYLDRLWPAWLGRPYLMWHLSAKAFIKFMGMPVEDAAACANGFYAALTFLITFWLLDRTASRLAKRDMGIQAALVSAMLGLVMALYVPWFNQYQYEGQFSINPMFNPTHMAVKPFGLLCFMLAVDLLLSYKEQETLYFTGVKRKKHLFILFGLFLFLSAFTKPTFMYMLLPAGFGFLLIDLAAALKRKDGSWKKVWGFMWRIGCASIPAVLYLLLEYAAFYLWGGTNDDASVAIYPFLTAWHIYSPDVPRSLRLSMAFPFWMVLTNLVYFWKSVEGRLAMAGYAVGTLEFCFVVETGDKLGHLNFSWPMMSGMLLLWVVSGARLIALTGKSGGKIGTRIIVMVGWILLSIHMFSGLYYINPYQYII